MTARKLVGRILWISATILVVIVIIYGIYFLGQKAYEFGYRIYMEEPMEDEPGIDVSVKITSDMDAGEIGTALKNKGLIRNTGLFQVQLLLASYDRNVIPGTYVFNTSMTAMEMCELMCTETEEEEEE